MVPVIRWPKTWATVLVARPPPCLNRNMMSCGRNFLTDEGIIHLKMCACARESENTTRHGAMCTCCSVATKRLSDSDKTGGRLVLVGFWGLSLNLHFSVMVHSISIQFESWCFLEFSLQNDIQCDYSNLLFECKHFDWGTSAFKIYYLEIFRYTISTLPYKMLN